MTNQTPTEKHYDVIVMGGGPGGYIAGERLAYLGNGVAIGLGESLGPPGGVAAAVARFDHLRQLYLSGVALIGDRM